MAMGAEGDGNGRKAQVETNFTRDDNEERWEVIAHIEDKAHVYLW